VSQTSRYRPLAAIYDRVMSHVEYDRWHELVDFIAAKHCRDHPPSVFEIGAGTGVLGRRLRAAGYDYTGSDLSFDMCRQAAARGLGPACADGRALPYKGRFDIVLFLYDGINYLLTEGDYAALFTETHRVLNPGGFFLFDITTRQNSMSYFLDHIYYEDLGDHYYVRHSYFEPGDSLQYNDFNIFRRCAGGRSYERADESHRQKLFSPQTIRRWIDPARFEIAGVWDGFSRRPFSRHSERIHFLLRRQGDA